MHSSLLKCSGAILRRRVTALRFLSSLGSVRRASTTTEINEKTGVATLTINRPPVNGLNLELMQEIRVAVNEIEHNRSRGLILTSALSSVFSAGLDIKEICKPEQVRLREVWTALQDMWATLYNCSIPTAAAINGHAPAGGCLLTICCDYRVMRPNFKIGLNEVHLGIPVPIWLMASFVNVLPRRVAERAVTEGTMFTTEAALKAGLIDDVAADKEAAITKCEEFLKSFAKIAPTASGMTKQRFRSDCLKLFEAERKNDLEQFISVVNQPSMQEGLEIYMRNLKRK